MLPKGMLNRICPAQTLAAGWLLSSSGDRHRRTMPCEYWVNTNCGSLKSASSSANSGAHGLVFILSLISSGGCCRASLCAARSANACPGGGSLLLQAGNVFCNGILVFRLPFGRLLHAVIRIRALFRQPEICGDVQAETIVILRCLPSQIKLGLRRFVFRLPTVFRRRGILLHQLPLCGNRVR